MADTEWEAIYIEAPAAEAAAVRLLLREMWSGDVKVVDVQGQVEYDFGARITWGRCPEPGSAEYADMLRRDQLRHRVDAYLAASPQDPTFGPDGMWGPEAEQALEHASERAAFIRRVKQREAELNSTAAEPPSSPAPSESDRQP